MPRTGENIYKRKDGRWEARYIKCYENNGKAKYGYLYAESYSAVKKKLIQQTSICNQALTTNSHVRTKCRYDDWLDDWLNFIKPRVKDSTFIRYRNTVDNHIKPFLGKYPIEKISTSLMEQFVFELINNGRMDNRGGLSAKSVTDILTTTRESFKYVQSNGISILCHFEHLGIKAQVQEKRVLSRIEEKNLVSYLLEDFDRYKMGVLLSLYTGVRIGELCALQWKNISFDDKTMKIEKTMQRLQKVNQSEIAKTHIIITEPKSISAIRTIPLTDSILSSIEKFKGLPNSFILSGTCSVYVEPRTMQNRFKSYINQSGIGDANFHSLRHTFATRCVESGFDIKSLSEILGHSSVKITLDKYVHSSIEQKRLNMEKLQCLI